MQTDMTIAKKSNRPKGLDYKQLYDLGMARIRSLCSEKWTDYNTHDPGITLLETLCYAITDMSYRAQMPVKDLLASEHNNIESMRDRKSVV